MKRTLTCLLALLALSDRAGPQDPPVEPAAPPEAPEEDSRPPEERYFETCDHDRNGWISFREARVSLSLDRAAFAGYDLDSDGRVNAKEFAARYAEALERVGGFRPPNPVTTPVMVPRRSSEQLRTAYDANASGTLELAELETLLSEYGYEEWPAEVVLERVDTDGSGRIEGEEALLVSRLLSAAHLGGSELEVEDLPEASTVMELFGGLAEPEEGVHAAASAPRIPGPVGHYPRLDLDRDGQITLAELERLLQPQQIQVRLGAVLATLDEDGDGGLSRAEFEGCMRH